jgi:hypothetical protein
MRIELASFKAIKTACLNFHYAKAVPSQGVSFSVFNDADEWCGVIIYAPGANSNIFKPYGLARGEVIELVRVAMNGKQNNVTQPLAMTLKALRRYAPAVKLVVSYADTEQDHAGIIYQAANFYYEGMTTVGVKLGFIINGKKVHSRTIGKRGVPQTLEAVRKHFDRNATMHTNLGKHKYIYPVHPSMIKLCKERHQPFPKKTVKPNETEKSKNNPEPTSGQDKRGVLSTDNQK